MLVLAAAPLLACSDSASGPDRLRLEITLNHTTLLRADSVMISLRMTNLSGLPVRVTAPASYGVCFHAFEVADQQNRDVTVNTAFCAAAIFAYHPPVDLAPGASVTIEDHWRPSTSFLDGQALEAGTYQLVGRVWRGEGMSGEAVRSSPVEITLLP